jgi:hypothetical protein
VKEIIRATSHLLKYLLYVSMEIFEQKKVVQIKYSIKRLINLKTNEYFAV